MRLYILLLLVVLPALSVSAFSIGSIYSGNAGACMESSSANFTCVDGRPIVVGFSLSAQTYPYYFYGNFTADVPLYSGYHNLESVYGGPCIVPSGATTVCFITLPAIPVTSSNGTVKINFTIVLRSGEYPQVNFTGNVSITIVHYINSTDYTVVALYNEAMERYNQTEPAYAYFCTSHFICNSTIGNAIHEAGSNLANASGDLNDGRITPAYLNVTAAYQGLSGVYPSFDTFRAMANNVINNNIAAEALVANASYQFNKNSKLLYNCSEAYTSKMNKSINGLESVPVISTLNASVGYLDLAGSIQKNVTEWIKSCTSGSASTTGSSLGSAAGQGGPSKGSSMSLSYIAILPLLAIVVYLAVRLKDAREVRRLRDEANRHDATKQQNNEEEARPLAKAEDGKPEHTEQKSK